MNIVKNLHNFLATFWEKSYDFSQFSFLDKIFFKFLVYCEFLYSFVFKVVCFIKRKKGGASGFPFPVIGVGNISVGGTGKSVIVSFLLKHLVPLKGAVVLRGYKGACQKKEPVLLLDDGVACDARIVGDEACVYKDLHKIPIVVGSDRAKSCFLLTRYINSNNFVLDYVLLDDAYQNFQVKKDLEILLLDARHPFENGHCLPAGRLREKDFSRADVIILTHADEVDERKLLLLNEFFEKNSAAHAVFSGKHAIIGIVQAGKINKESEDELLKKTFIAVAGIGSFHGFAYSLKEVGVNVVTYLEYPDHFEYTKEDVRDIVETAKRLKCCGIITTRKDWHRFRNFIGDNDSLFFILDIEFSFLTSNEHEQFILLLKKLLKK